MARPRITIRGWMAAVGVSAVILTGFRSPALAGVMAISGLFIMRCKVAAKPERPMSAIDWISIAGLAVLALFSEYILSWILFFSPGWTNGWPFGLSSQTVLSAAITGWISLMLMTAAAGAGAVVGFICSLLRVGEKHGGQVYRSWLWFAALVILCLSIWIFANIHAWVWKEFPNGYMIP